MSENITTCLKCGNTMSEPVELQCFHAFCKKCLPISTKDKNEVECPKCCQMSSVPDIDEFTCSFIDIISRQRHMTEKCSKINSNGLCHGQASFFMSQMRPIIVWQMQIAAWSARTTSWWRYRIVWERVRRRISTSKRGWETLPSAFRFTDPVLYAMSRNCMYNMWSRWQ